MTEAARCLTNVVPKNVNQHHRTVEMIQKRLSDIKKFIDVRRIFERGDTQTGMNSLKLKEKIVVPKGILPIINIYYIVKQNYGSCL